jgi:hypothetical protein
VRLGHQVVCVSPLYRKPPPEYACRPLGVHKEFQVFGQRFKVGYCHTIKQGMSPASPRDSQFSVLLSCHKLLDG